MDQVVPLQHHQNGELKTNGASAEAQRLGPAVEVVQRVVPNQPLHQEEGRTERMASANSNKSRFLTEVEGANGVKWKVAKKLGSGSFGDVFLGQQDEDPKAPREIAIKVEALKCAHPQLAYEARLLSVLKGNLGVSEVYHSGVHLGYNILCMELLSHSLEDLLVICGGKFSLKSTLLLADQLICRIEDVHAAGFLHRDIKPENFLIGCNQKASTVFVIDFGLSKRYCEPKTREHIPYKDNKSLTGTARYASINAHRGVEQSRRDDLEAIGHMLLYFIRGALPWQGLPAKTKDEKYTKIKEKKIETPIEHLCSGIPEEFSIYLQYVRALRFQDRPDYAYLKALFGERYTREGFDRQEAVFDWAEKLKPTDHKVPPPDISKRDEKRVDGPLQRLIGLCSGGNKKTTVKKSPRTTR